MCTYDNTPTASGTDDDLVAVDETSRRADPVETPPRRLLDRFTEAVRAAHAASVPF